MLAVLLLGGIAGGIAYSSAMENRRKDADAVLTPIREGLDNLDVENGLKEIFKANFKNLTWFRTRTVSVKDANEEQVIESAISLSSADAVAVITPYYQFNRSLSEVGVTLRYAMYASSSRVRASIGETSGSSKPFFQSEHSWVVEIPAEERGSLHLNALYWADNDSEKTKAALSVALQFAAAKLHTALTNSSSDVTAHVIAAAPVKADSIAKTGPFASAALREAWFRKQLGNIAVEWPENYRKILQACDQAALQSNCSGFVNTAALDRKGRIDQLVDECVQAPVTDTSESDPAIDCIPPESLNNFVSAETPQGTGYLEVIGQSGTIAGQTYVAPPIPKKFRTPGYKQLGSNEIKALFQGLESANHLTMPGHYSSVPWTINYLSSGRWNGVHGSRGFRSAGVWRAANDKLCLDIKQGFGQLEQLNAGCYYVYVDWQEAKIAIKASEGKTRLFVVKEFVSADLRRLLPQDGSGSVASTTAPVFQELQQSVIPGKFRTPGFKKLDGEEIRTLYEGLDSAEHFTMPGHYSSFPWILTYNKSGNWQGKNPSRGSESAGTWRVENNQLCLKLIQGFGLQEQLSDGCYSVYVDWGSAIIAIEGRGPRKGLHHVKKNAFADIARLSYQPAS